MPNHPSDPFCERVHLEVDDLPSEIARQIRDVQLNDPDFLKNVLLYGITHRTVFETLDQAWRS